MENNLQDKMNPGEGRLRWWMLALIALVALGVYANSISNGFAYDDLGVLRDNPRVMERQWLELWNTGYWPEWEGTPDVLYRPLTIWSYVVNEAIASQMAWPYHAVNVALHALASVLVACLAFRLSRRSLPALIAGILFALHPLHTEVVANVVGRAEIIAAIWLLLMFLIMLPGRELLEGPVRRAWWHGWLVAACFFLAMLSKETPAAMLGGVLALDLWRWSQWKPGRPTLYQWLKSQSMRYYFPLTIAFGVYMAMRLHAVGFMSNNKTVHPIVNPLLVANVGERIVTPFVLLAKYMKLMAWPQVLLADYSAPSIMPVSNPFNAQAALGILLCLGAIVAVVVNWRKRPALAATLVLLFFSYFLVSNAIRIGTIFGERLFYLPSAFVLILVGLVASGCWEKLKSCNSARALRLIALLVPAMLLVMLILLFKERLFSQSAGFLAFFVVAGVTTVLFQWKRGPAAGIACSLSITCLMLLSVRTFTRNPDWNDNLNLALATAADNPTSSKALAWAGQELINQKGTRWMEDVGVDLLKRAIEAYPSNGQAYFDLAKYYGLANENDRALIYLAQAARYHAGKPDIRFALTAIREDLRTRDPHTYFPGVQENLRAHPEDPSAHFAAGIAAWANNDKKNAEQFFWYTLNIDPHFEEARMELAQLKMDEGEPLEAAQMMQRYIKLAGFNLPARCQYITALLAVDAQANPWVLEEADTQLNEAARLLTKDPKINVLRSILRERRATAQSHPAVSLLTPRTAVDAAKQ